MRSLTDEQIDFIADDIRIRGVFTQSLQEDLLDHICCFIEEQDDERPFEEIYRRALDAFGQQGLQGIQDETLYLVNRPYLTKMKKIAYFSGAISSLCIIGGALFKVEHWPGANMMLIAGTLIMSLFFIPYFFYTQFTEQTERKGKIIAGLGLATALLLATGALFKLMHWPGAIVMIIGFIVFFVAFLPLYIINGARNPLTRLTSVSNGFLFACIGGFMLLLSFQQPSKAVTDSLAVIEQNQYDLLVSMNKQFNASDATPAEKTAMSNFIAQCDQSLLTISDGKSLAPLGNGAPVTNEELESFNASIVEAVNKLNIDMAGNMNWKRIEFQKFQPSLYGSLRFQVLQLEEEAYVNAR